MRQDQNYVIDLCDQALGFKASREHSFDFLRGDPNKKGTRRKLNVDAYYKELEIVVEYYEKQHTESVTLFDSRMTLSGVTRREQRAIYDQRRKDILPKHGIKLVIISFNDFDFDKRKRILRNKESDIATIKSIFKKSNVSFGTSKQNV